jgi:hypothetical protein
LKSDNEFDADLFAQCLQRHEGERGIFKRDARYSGFWVVAVELVLGRGVRLVNMMFV